MNQEEKTIRGLRVCEYEAIPSQERGRRTGFTIEYWKNLFESLQDHWVNVADIKKQTTYALDGIRRKATQCGFVTIVSRDKNWLYIKSKSMKD